jgi:chromosome segregation ATPase
MKQSTHTLAYDACEAFFLETGLMPTIEAIKSIIEINSPTTISNAIKDWKQALSQSVKRNQNANPNAPDVLINAINGIWEQALLEAQNALQQHAVELEKTQNALAQKENALNDEEKHIRHLVQLTEQKYQEEIVYLKKELNRVLTDSTALTEQGERFRTLASEHDKKNAILNEQLRQEQEKYSRLEKQYENEHSWSLKRIEEEKNNYKQQVQNDMSRLQSEASRNRQSNELLQAKLELVIDQLSDERNKALDLERNLANEKLKLAGFALNEANLQKALREMEAQITGQSNKARTKKVKQ